MAGSPRSTTVIWLPGTRCSTGESPSAPTCRTRYSVTVSLPDGSQVSVYIPGGGPLESTRRFAGARMLTAAAGAGDGGASVAPNSGAGVPGAAPGVGGPLSGAGTAGSPPAAPAGVGDGVARGAGGTRSPGGPGDIAVAV